jgi:hypothetical protein
MNPLVEQTHKIETEAGAKGFDKLEHSLLVENAAQTAYNVIKVYADHIGDRSFKPWVDTTEANRTSYIKGVEAIIEKDLEPRELHKSWLKEKLDTGWKYGPVKDEEKKEHPAMVDYDELPTHQQMKDTIFRSVVKGYLSVHSVYFKAKT